MTIKSPCKLICKYDENKVCIGCYRNMEEITGWIDYSDQEKMQVYKNIRTRKQQ